jgi:hypothetical protein
MLKTICLYKFFPHIHSDNNFSVCKKGRSSKVNKNGRTACVDSVEEIYANKSKPGAKEHHKGK